MRIKTILILAILILGVIFFTVYVQPKIEAIKIQSLIKPLSCLSAIQVGDKEISVASDSNSMLPTIKFKDAVVSEKISNLSSLKIGDIIIFSNSNNLIVHRIVKITEGGFYTKGDNNNDSEFTPNSVVENRVIGLIC